MIRAAAYVAAGVALGVAVAAAIFGFSPRAAGPGLVLPSGQRVAPYQFLWEQHPDLSETWLVMRFLAPRVAREGGDITYEKAEADFLALCQQVGLAVARLTGGADEIQVELIDRPFPRGRATPQATSLRAGFRPAGERCEGEGLAND